MSESIEIEFKTLLTEEEYTILCKYFQLEEKDFFTQTNVYYDTKDSRLKEDSAGLRIRLYDDYAEATLKTPKAGGLLETTDTLTLSEAKKLIKANRFPAEGEIAVKLSKMNIAAPDLQIIADLTTRRAEFSIKEGLLAIDESWYSNQHDYELELEVSDARDGKTDFLALLDAWGITYRPAENKIRRAVEARGKV